MVLGEMRLRCLSGLLGGIRLNLPSAGPSGSRRTTEWWCPSDCMEAGAWRITWGDSMVGVYKGLCMELNPSDGSALSGHEVNVFKSPARAA